MEESRDNTEDWREDRQEGNRKLRVEDELVKRWVIGYCMTETHYQQLSNYLMVILFFFLKFVTVQLRLYF